MTREYNKRIRFASGVRHGKQGVTNNPSKESVKTTNRSKPEFFYTRDYPLNIHVIFNKISTPEREDYIRKILDMRN